MKYCRIISKLLILNAILSLVADPSLACMRFIYDYQLGTHRNTPRSQVHVYTYDKKQNLFYDLPVQIDRYDHHGRLHFEGDGWIDKAIKPSDRISFDSSLGGDELPPKAAFPCKTKFKKRYTFQRGSGPKKHFYIVGCDKKKNAMKASARYVNYLNSEKTVLSQRYRYHVHKDNHILFNEVAAFPIPEAKLEKASTGSKSKGKPDKLDKIVIATSSDLHIKADAKYFFTFIFDQSDINSDFDNYFAGPLGVVAKLGFYLNLLTFKIKLSLTTDLSFFRDSAFIPMVMHLPENATGKLNPGSGIFYTWKSHAESVDSSDLPKLNPKVSIAEKQFLDRPCFKGFCQYRLEMVKAGQKFKMHFNLPRQLVQQGFFPQFMTKTSEELFDDLGLPSQDKGYHDNRIGVYFETSSLPAGDHQWQFSMQVAPQGDGRQCFDSLSMERVAPVP